MRIRLLSNVGWVSDSVTQHLQAKNVGLQKSTNPFQDLLCVWTYPIGIQPVRQRRRKN